jgi:protein arginine kinase activator
MLCECQQRQALIHEVIIQHGQKVERHLCEQCASKLGVSTDPHMPISQLISNYISGKNLSIPTVGSKDKAGIKKDAPGTTPPCPSCSQSFSKFKDTGLLGCPSCYTSFQRRITPLIARAHDGGEQHVGKVPKRALHALSKQDQTGLETLLGGASEREQRLTQVRKKLVNAVEHEDYEQAAMLRDEMTRLASLPSTQIEARPAPTESVPNESALNDSKLGL